MDVSSLQERKMSLENDIKIAKQTMAMLNDQVETAKAQFHVLSGHHHEVGYQLDCLVAQLEQARLAKEEADKLAAESKPLKRA